MSPPAFILSGVDTKTCTKCGETKPRTPENYGRNSGAKDGLFHWCKACVRLREQERWVRDRDAMSAKNKEYYARDPEGQKARTKAYYADHAEERRAYARKWAAEHPERVEENHRAYRVANAEKRKAYNKKWRAEHPGYFVARARERDARLRGTSNELIRRLDVLERAGWKCALCGDAIPADATWPSHEFGTVDHIVPVSRGGEHTWDNVQAAHWICNHRKGARSLPDAIASA
jgi:5-methylcytosine-specific restriction endonuclease McrA